MQSLRLPSAEIPQLLDTTTSGRFYFSISAPISLSLSLSLVLLSREMRAKQLHLNLEKCKEERERREEEKKKRRNKDRFVEYSASFSIPAISRRRTCIDGKLDSHLFERNN